MKRKDFSDFYTPKSPHCGLRPSAWIVSLAADLDAAEGRRCLDLGCGHGRNALYLAKKGFEVTAVDSSPSAVAFLERAAGAERLPLRVLCEDIERFDIEPGSYDLVLMITVLGSIDRASVARLARSAERGLRRGGILAVEEFSPLDPGAAGDAGSICASEFSHLVTNYFSPADVKGLFRDLDEISCSEHRVKDGMHGHVHRHSVVRYAAGKLLRADACTEAAGRGRGAAVCADD